MYPETDFLQIGGTECNDTFASMRRPIQCEGLARGPARMAEVGVSGSINPQFSWKDALGIGEKLLPIAAGLL